MDTYSDSMKLFLWS